MTNTRRLGRLTVVLCALLAVSGAVAPLAAAQSAPNGTAATPAANGSTNSSANGTGVGYGGGRPVGYPGYNASTTNNSDGNFSNVCKGLPPGAWVMCKGTEGLIGGTIKKGKELIVTTLQNTAEKFIRLLLSRPIPLSNGSVEFVLQPTNPPMTTVYNLWATVGMPVAIGIWVLYMIIMRFGSLLPSSMLNDAERQRMAFKGWFALVDILLSWVQAAIIVTLAFGIAQIFAPSGEQVIASFGSIGETALAAGIGALLVFLSSGVLLVLMLLVWGLSFLGVFVLMPAYPVATALSLPDYWIFKPLTIPGKWLQGLFVPCAFMPVPSAIILGFGYPVINAVRGELSGPFASFIGVPTFVILLLVMWFAALVAPLLLLASARQLRPMAAFTAGAVGAASVGAASGKMPSVGSRAKNAAGSASSAASSAKDAAGSAASRLDSGGSGGPGSGSRSSAGRVDPIAGSPYSATDDSRALGGGSASPPAETGSGPSAGSGASHGGSRALGAGSSSSGTSASSSPSGSPSASGSTGGSAAAAGSAGTATSSASSATGSTTTATDVPTASAATGPEEAKQVRSIDELDAEQDYTPGYYRENGEFQSAIDGDGRDRDYLLKDDGYERIQSAREGKELRLRGEDDDGLYDVRDVARSRESYTRDAAAQTEESRDTVFGSTRSGGR